MKIIYFDNGFYMIGKVKDVLRYLEALRDRP